MCKKNHFMFETLLAILFVSLCAAEKDVTLYLPFDDSLDPKVSVNQNNFRSYGQTQYVDGIIGKALIVGGESRCVYPIDKVNVNGTMSLWVQPIDWDYSEEKFYFFLALSNSQESKSRILLYKVHNAEPLTLLFQNSHDNVSLNKSIITWRKKQWHHLVFTWDTNGELKFYSDGKLAGKQKYNEISPENGWNLLLGVPFPAWPHLGQGSTAIDELTFFQRVLSDEEIKKIYQSTAVAVNINPAKPGNLATKGNGAYILTSSFRDTTNFYSDNLIDEDNESVWRAWDNEFPQWLEVRWSNPMHINKINFNEISPTVVTSYSIYAKQGSQWQLLKKSDKRQSIESSIISCDFNEVVTDRLRFVMESGKWENIQLSDFEVFGPSQPVISQIEPYWKAWYIWYPEADKLYKTNSPRYFRKSFNIDNIVDIKSAYIQLRSNDYYKAYINGREVAAGSVDIKPVQVRDFLRQGKNTIAVICDLMKNPGEFGWAELIVELNLNYEKQSVRFGTDETWKSNDTLIQDWQDIDFDDSEWKDSIAFVRPPNGIWGKIPYYATAYCEKVIFNGISVVPEEAKPGNKVRIDIKLTPENKLERDYVFEVELKGAEASSQRNNFSLTSSAFESEIPTSKWPQNKTCTISTYVYLPEYSPHEIMPIYLRAIDKETANMLNICDSHDNSIQNVGSLRIKRFDEEPNWGKLPISKIQQKNNSPVLSIGEEIYTPVSWMIHSPSYEKFHLYSKAANNIFWLCEYAKPNGSKETTRKVLENLDTQIRHLLAIDLNALIFLSIELRPDSAWLNANPNERLITGSGALGPVSFASRKYHQLIDDHMRSILDFISRQPYASRVIGYRPMSFGLADSTLGGRTENTFQKNRTKVVIGDYNPQAIKLFQDYLHKKYNDSLDELQKSWKNKSVTFETAVPVLAELTSEPIDGGVFTDPTNGNKNYDYLEFLSKLISSNYFRLYDLIKEATDNKVIVGTHFGYSIEHMRSVHAAGAKGDNNFEIENMLDERSLDFYAGAMAYDCRMAGLPYKNMFCQGSLRLHKKLQMNDADYRTFIAGATAHGRQRSIKETVSVLQRDRATMIIDGFGCWYSDISESDGRTGVGWFTDHNILNTIDKMNDIYKTVIQTPQKSTTEIAVFINGKTWNYHDVYGSQNIYNNLVRRVIYDELPRLGTPFDVYYLSDLEDDYVQNQYKMYVFINPYYMSDKELHSVERLKKNGKTLFWFYAPGYVSRATGLTADNISNITGINVKKKINKEEMQYSITNTNHIITESIKSGEIFKMTGFGGEVQKMHPLAFAPVFYVEDANAVTLGIYPDDKTALAVKDMGNWKSVYCAVPYADKTLLRGVAKFAGVHFYCDLNVIMDADNRLVMIHNGFEGSKNLNITLPQKHTVYDALNGNLIGRNVNIIQTNLNECQTKLFLLKTPE